MTVQLDGRSLTLEAIEAVAAGESVGITPAAQKRVAAARDFVER